jgi:hypothetical protein
LGGRECIRAVVPSIRLTSSAIGCNGTSMTMEELLGFLGRHWGDVASVIGFAFAMVTLLLTKRAAEAARHAAVEVRERLNRVNIVADFAEVLATIEEIKRLHRVKAWEISLDRYSFVRRLLVSVQESSPSISEVQRAVLAGAIEQFRTMEQTVERARYKNAQDDLDLARLNKTAARILDELNGVMISVRQAAD